MKIKTLCLSLLFLLILPVLASATTLHWVSGINLTPQQPKSGDTITLQALIRADRQDETDFTIVAGVDNKELFNRSFKVFKAGKSKYIRFRWKAIAGKHSAYFKIIPKGRSAKQKISKKGVKDPLRISKRFKVGTLKVNTIIKPIQVKQAEINQPVCEGRPLPDIAATGMSLSNGDYPGDVLGVSIGLRNLGQCATGPFNVRLDVYIQIPDEQYYQTIEIGRKLVGSIDPCTSRNCSEAKASAKFQFKTLNKPHAYYEFSAYPDYDNNVEEFNEENNDWERITTYTLEAN